MKIIFATGNQGKMKEVKMILSDLGYEIQSMKEAGIDIDIVEDGKTFEENAMIKAQAIAKMEKAIVLADDSGLEVDYLNKEPGIHSARYLGEDTPYEEKNKKIMEQLEGVEQEKRTARFVCAIAGVMPNGKTFTTRAAIEGYIGTEAKGNNGFGYDPIFYVPEFNCTTAQLTLEQKNKISHRGKALEKAKQAIKELI